MRVRTNLYANYAGQGWAALMAVVFVPLYIRLLGIEAFALIGFFTMLQTWLTLLDLGIMPTAVREMARYTSGASPIEKICDLLRSFELVCLGIGLAVALAFWASAHFLASEWLNAQAIPENTVAEAIALMGVVLACRLGEGVYRSCLIGLQRQVWLNAATALFATVRGAGAVAILFWVDRSIQAFFLWQAAISVVALIVMGLTVHALLPRGPRRARFSLRELRSVSRFAAGMLGINFLALLLTQADKVILSRLLSLQDYGYYMLAATVTGMMYTFVMPITQAVYPAMVEHIASDERAALARTFHGGAQVAGAVLGPAGLMLVIFPAPLLFVWSGDMTLAHASGPLVSFLAVGTLFNILMQMPYHLQIAHGRTRLVLAANTAAVLLLVPCLLWFVPQYGAVAAAIIWAALNVFYLAVIAPLIFRGVLRGEGARWYMRDLAAPLAASLAVLVPASLIPLEAMSRWQQGLIVLVAGAAATGAALLATGGAAAVLRRPEAPLADAPAQPSAPL